jgi:hypothetical protein
MHHQAREMSFRLQPGNVHVDLFCGGHFMATQNVMNRLRSQAEIARNSVES